MLKARAVENLVLWALSIVLAAIFFLAGAPKLLGISPIGFEAAAMRGFPTWIRVVVGIAELAGAVGLLFPSVATISALLLAFLMFPAAITQLASGQPGVWVPLLLMGALLLVAWRRNAKELNDTYRGFAATPHPLLHDGVIAGLIGASVIAVWFLILDTLAGRPLHTPAVLGRALIGVFGPIPATDGPLTFVLAYTAFHFAAFMVVGLIASLVVFLARREPSILLAFVLLFVVTEVGIYGLVGALDVGSSLGRSAWLAIMAGNLLAAVAMGIYFWRTHKELAHEFRHTLDWERPEDSEREPVGTGTGRGGDSLP